MSERHDQPKQASKSYGDDATDERDRHCVHGFPSTEAGRRPRRVVGVGEIAHRARDAGAALAAPRLSAIPRTIGMVLAHPADVEAVPAFGYGRESHVHSVAPPMRGSPSRR